MCHKILTSYPAVCIIPSIKKKTASAANAPKLAQALSRRAFFVLRTARSAAHASTAHYCRLRSTAAAAAAGRQLTAAAGL